MPFIFLREVLDLALTQQKRILAVLASVCLCWYLDDATELDSRLFQSRIVEG